MLCDMLRIKIIHIMNSQLVLSNLFFFKSFGIPVVNSILYDLRAFDSHVLNKILNKVIVPPA